MFVGACFPGNTQADHQRCQFLGLCLCFFRWWSLMWEGNPVFTISSLLMGSPVMKNSIKIVPLWFIGGLHAGYLRFPGFLQMNWTMTRNPIITTRKVVVWICSVFTKLYRSFPGCCTSLSYHSYFSHSDFSHSWELSKTKKQVKIVFSSLTLGLDDMSALPLLLGSAVKYKLVGSYYIALSLMVDINGEETQSLGL